MHVYFKKTHLFQRIFVRLGEPDGVPSLFLYKYFKAINFEKNEERVNKYPANFPGSCFHKTYKSMHRVGNVHATKLR